MGWTSSSRIIILFLLKGDFQRDQIMSHRLRCTCSFISPHSFKSHLRFGSLSLKACERKQNKVDIIWDGKQIDHRLSPETAPIDYIFSSSEYAIRFVSKPQSTSIANSSVSEKVALVAHCRPCWVSIRLDTLAITPHDISRRLPIFQCQG